jgi:hypothetical protein
LILKAARRLMQHAYAFRPCRMAHLQQLNGPFLYVDRDTPEECAAGLALAISLGWLEITTAERS